MTDPKQDQSAPRASLAANQHICYSTNEEEFTHRELGDLIDSMRASSDRDENLIGMTYYSGVATVHVPSYFFSVDDLIEQLRDRAYDEAGEWAEDFASIGKDKEAELAALIGAWLDANLTVNFWTVDDTRAHVVAAEDLS